MGRTDEEEGVKAVQDQTDVDPLSAVVLGVV